MALKLRGSEYSLKYRLPMKKETNYVEDLWGERKEWVEYDYPGIIEAIISVDRTLFYDRLLVIMKKYEIPIDYGLPMRAIMLLADQGKIIIKRGRNYRIEYVRTN